MSNTRTIGTHSMEMVHRVVKRRKRAGVRSRMQFNRRLIRIGGYEDFGPNTQQTKDLVDKELNYHFTKGFRSRSA